MTNKITKIMKELESLMKLNDFFYIGGMKNIEFDNI